MALVIDFTGKTPTKNLRPSPTKPLETDGKQTWELCKHRQCVIDKEQRTVTCKTCKALVEPVSYILLLYHEYETRIDRRLDEIREYDRRAKELSDRAAKRDKAPKRAKIARRLETAERAAYNEYQAKVLAARAERQRQLVTRLDKDIAGMPEDEPASSAS